MHLVRIRHLFYPDMPRDYFFELCQRQVAFGYRVGLVTWNKSGNSLPSQSVEGFTIFRLPGPNVGFSFLPEYPFLPSLPKVVSTLMPDIIHAESHLFLPTAQAIRTAARLKVPGIVTVHGLRVSRGPLVDLAEGLYLRTVARRVFETASRVICLTDVDARDTVEYGCPAGKISVIPNGVDSELFRPGDKPTEKLILWTGRFVPEKGLPILLRAAKTVAARVEGVKFLLVGFGPGRSEIERMARDMGLSPGIVEFEGPVTREEVAQILRRAMVFAFPSLQEGLPLSLLEAMA
ncbi:MAG: glycosyltransferase family 4 protein, partial [Nitrososphaerales archaeon]